MAVERTTHRLLKNQSGSLLVYVMLTVAALAIYLYSMVTTVRNLQSQVTSSKLKSDRDYRIREITTDMRLANGLLESSALPANAKLSSCIAGGSSGSCASHCCDNGVDTGFYFVDPADANVSQKHLLTGAPSSPARYNKDGSFCTTQNGCAYTIASTFKAHCPGGVAQCDHAEHLEIQVNKVVSQDVPGTTLIRNEEIKFNYVVNLNYQPFIEEIPPINIYLGDPVTEKDITVTGNAGHPSEVQNFKFTDCVSTNETIAKVTTPVDQPFTGGSATIKVKGLAKGIAQIRLKIDDGQSAHSLSEEKLVTVNVFDGVSGP